MSFLLFIAVVARASASPMLVTLSGNFGTPQDGSSSFDNQNYTVAFVIPDLASPSPTCCLSQISGTYDVNAQLAVPGIGLSINNDVRVDYGCDSLDIFYFTGLPVGDALILAPFQISNGELWNGLAGTLDTPAITSLNSVPGTAIWHLEQNTNAGPIPIADYAYGPVTISAAAVPEPEPGWLLAGAFFVWGIFAMLRRKARFRVRSPALVTSWLESRLYRSAVRVKN